MNKDEIRKAMIKERNEIKDRDKLDYIIKKRLKESDFYKQSNNIFIYVGFGSEINTIHYINEFLEEGKRVFVPRTDIRTKTMEAVEIKSLDDLEKSNYGILEPKKEKEAIDRKELELIIIPGVAFDKKGYRIGYGAGYYDKFLNNIKTNHFRVALCYDFQIIDEVPYEKHDAKIGYILTEKRKILV